VHAAGTCCARHCEDMLDRIAVLQQELAAEVGIESTR
jgi:hypothetical protein